MWGDPHANLSDPSIKVPPAHRPMRFATSSPALSLVFQGTLLPNFSRGGGSSFGTECARLFLEREGLKGLIRSHQCVPEGYTTTDCGNGPPRLPRASAPDGMAGADAVSLSLFSVSVSVRGLGL